MAFGQKTGSLKNLKKSLAKGGGAGFIKYIPKNGSMNVRFIQQPEEWVNYVEHYDQTIRKSYPCSGEASCPGCASGERKSSRYLANAVDLDDAQNRVIPLQMPKDLANRLVVKYEKWGSLTDRDIELSRSGEGLDTVYDLDASVPDRKSITKYQPIDLLKTLEDAYNNVFGDDDEDEDDEPPKKSASGVRGRKTSAAAKAAKPAADSTLDDDDEDDEEDEKPAPRKRAAAKRPAKPVVDEDDEVDEEDEPEEKPAPRKRAAKKPAPEPEFVPEEDEPEDDEPEEDDEDEEYTEEELRALPLGALRSVAREFGIATKGKSTSELVDEIMENGEEPGF